jgi:hypothetical protein
MTNQLQFNRQPDEFKAESKAENQRRNNNERNNTITDFFAGLLKCSWFKNIILSSLTLIVVVFYALFICLLIFISKENSAMIDLVLGVAIKIATPCVIIFLFFFRFGEYKEK